MLQFLHLLVVSASLYCVGFPPITDLDNSSLQQVNQNLSTPEGVLARAVQAIGGHRELQAIESFYLHGTIRLSSGGPLVEVELATSQGGKVLGVMTFIEAGQSRFGSDGETAWEQNFGVDGTPTWSTIDQATLSQKVRQMNWVEWFTMLPTQLENIEFEGSVIFDGEECWKLRIKGKGEQYQLAFFSCTTHRPRGRRTIESIQEGDVTVDVYFREWKRVGNLVLFHTVVFDRDGSQVTMKLDRIELDNVKDELFELPEQIVQPRDAP